MFVSSKYDALVQLNNELFLARCLERRHDIECVVLHSERALQYQLVSTVLYLPKYCERILRIDKTLVGTQFDETALKLKSLRVKKLFFPSSKDIQRNFCSQNQTNLKFTKTTFLLEKKTPFAAKDEAGLSQLFFHFYFQHKNLSSFCSEYSKNTKTNKKKSWKSPRT
jgi:hypothetical protein